MDGIFIGIVAGFGFSVLLFMIGAEFGDRSDKYKEEAILLGYAKWVCDEKGNTEFKWNTAPEKPDAQIKT